MNIRFCHTEQVINGYAFP